MICPQCRAEYRDGFTHCADCDVPLVDQPPAEAATPHASVPEPGDPSHDPFCAFWKGDDPRLHLELCSVLNEVGIPHKTVRRRDHLFNLANYPAFELGVPFSLFESAEKAVRDAFGLAASDDAIRLLTVADLLPNRVQSPRKLPASLSPEERESLPGPPSAGDDSPVPDEQEGAARVWSGDDLYLRDAIIAALHENGIRCLTSAREQGVSLSVAPERQLRAREIVREVTQSTPPK